MKKICLIAMLAFCAAAAEAQDSRAAAYEPPVFEESEWTFIGTGFQDPGILDYFDNEYPDGYETKVYKSNINPGDYWIAPITDHINLEENVYPGPFIVHAQNPAKVWTDPIWSLHPMIFCFYQNVPEIMGINGSSSCYGKLDNNIITFPAGNYVLMTMPTGTPTSNNAGEFAIILPDESGICDITADDTAAVYYNLQGVAVEHPDHGMYIVKSGNTVRKVRF